MCVFKCFSHPWNLSFIGARQTRYDRHDLKGPDDHVLWREEDDDDMVEALNVEGMAQHSKSCRCVDSTLPSLDNR